MAGAFSVSGNGPKIVEIGVRRESVPGGVKLVGETRSAGCSDVVAKPTRAADWCDGSTAYQSDHAWPIVSLQSCRPVVIGAFAVNCGRLETAEAGQYPELKPGRSQISHLY